MIIGLIPARAGSLSIRNKNLVDGPKLFGKTLIDYTIEAALGSSLDATGGATNDVATLRVMERLPGIFTHRRSDVLSGSDSPTEATIEAVLEEWPSVEACVLLQLTSPLRTSADIDRALAQFRSDGSDSLVSVVPEYGFTWYEGIEGARGDYDPLYRPMRQEQHKWKENGAIYIFSRAWWDQHHVRCGGKVSLYKMGRETGIEVDEALDLALVAAIMAARNEPMP